MIISKKYWILNFHKKKKCLYQIYLMHAVFVIPIILKSKKEIKSKNFCPINNVKMSNVHNHIIIRYSIIYIYFFFESICSILCILININIIAIYIIVFIRMVKIVDNNKKEFQLFIWKMSLLRRSEFKKFIF